VRLYLYVACLAICFTGVSARAQSRPCSSASITASGSPGGCALTVQFPTGTNLGGGSGGGGFVTAIAGAFADGALATMGTQADAVWSGTGPGSEIALLKAIWVQLSTAKTVNGTVNVGNFPATQPVSGSVAVSNFPATQPVSGSVAVSNFPATQPVSGSVAVSNFPATQPVNVGNFPATQPVSGSVAVSNFPATQAVTEQTLDATDVPIGGGVAGTAAIGVGCQYNSTDIVLTNGQASQCAETLNAWLKVYDEGMNIVPGTLIGTNGGPLMQAETTTATPTYTNTAIRPTTQSSTGQLHVTLGNLTTANPAQSTAPSTASSVAYSPLIDCEYLATAPTVWLTGGSAVKSCDSQGEQYVNTQSLKTSDTIASSITLAANPTDVACIWGSATKTIRVTHLRVYASATTAGQMIMQIVKRSAVNSGGTFTAATIVPHDTLVTSVSATNTIYTANPTTLGATVGSVETAILDFGAGAAGPPFDRQFGADNDEPIVLRGIGQGLCIDLSGGVVPSGTAPASPIFSFSAIYTEE
jgi:hypothetical protein